MHARPAGKLSALCKQFRSRILVRLNEKEADGKRLLALMGLGASCGSVLHLEINGEDEDAALAALKAHLNDAEEE